MMKKLKPMETAPRSGEQILVYGLAGWDGNYKSYKSFMTWNVVYWRDDMEWWQVKTCSFYCETMQPLGWMELPKIKEAKP